MNEVITWNDLPEPSESLPCNALPFGILQDVCRILDARGVEEKWKVVAALFSDVFDVERIRYIDSIPISHKSSPTVRMLEDLWSSKSLTIGEFVNILKKKRSLKQLRDRLNEYIGGSIPEKDCRISSDSSNLTEDPRPEVRMCVECSHPALHLKFQFNFFIWTGDATSPEDYYTYHARRSIVPVVVVAQYLGHRAGQHNL